MGLVNVFSVTTPALHDRLTLLRAWLPLEVRFGSHLAATLSGFALILLAASLWRRKRTAWSLTIVLLIVSAFGHLFKGLDYEEAGLAVGLALWLLRLRGAFQARSDRPSVRHALCVLAVALVFTLTYGVLGLAFLDHHFSVNFDLAQAARQVALMFTLFDAPGVVPTTPFGSYFVDSIYVVAAVTMGYALLRLMTPVLVRAPASPAERVRAREIVEAHGKTSLAWFALADDKSYFFSPGGSIVAFVVRRGVCLALGDVIGPPEDVSDALAGFCEFCARNDWRPALVATEPDALPQYRAAGFDALCIGHEAIIPLADFSLAGGHNKDVRGRVTRLRRLGYSAHLHAPPLTDMFLEELRTVSDAWLDMVGGMEQSFSMGAFEEDLLRHCPVMALHGPDGAVCAFANLYPEFRRNEATVDLMRRQVGENGVMEMLVVSLLEWARDTGYDSFNLGLSLLGGIGGQRSDPATERALHRLFERSPQFYNFKGLHGFKAKFHPQWSPRYLIHPGAASLPTITLAFIQANAGDDAVWRTIGWRRAGPPTSRPVREHAAPGIQAPESPETA